MLDLYPKPKCELTAAMIAGVDTGDRDERGNRALHRPLTVEERKALAARSAEIVPWLKQGKYSDVKAVILQMIPSAAKRTDDSTAMLGRYCADLKEVPPWSIHRALMRFAAGQIRPDEIGAERLPEILSTHQIMQAARFFLKPLATELSAIRITLMGTVVRRVLGDAERERLNAKVAAHLEESASRGSSDVEDEKRRERVSAEAMERGTRLVEREYHDAGVDVPAGMLVSLPMRLKLGWRIENVGGARKLLAPGAMNEERS